METQIVRAEERPATLAKVEEAGISIEEIVARVEKIHAVQTRLMKAGVHYGVVPGTGSKPTLLKPGAELLCMTFQLAPKFELDERWDGEHLEVVVTCTLSHAPTGNILGSGIGSCSTRESKYAYRKGERVCPKCGKSTIIKGKQEYGGGWLCFGKKGGCGAKFGDHDEAIVGQNTDRVANPDLADLYNTVRKMGCKRAHVAASLFVTGGSELFTQDVEDMPQDQRRSQPIDPHAHPDDDGHEGERDNTAFDDFMSKLVALETRSDSCSSYSQALGIREALGSKAKPGDLLKAMQVAREGRKLASEHSRALGKTWHRIDRKLTKLEADLATGAEESLRDGDDSDDSDFDNAELGRVDNGEGAVA